MSTSEYLRCALRSRGISIRELAQRTGLRPGTVREVIAGKRVISARIYRDLRHACSQPPRPEILL